MWSYWLMRVSYPMSSLAVFLISLNLLNVFSARNQACSRPDDLDHLGVEALGLTFVQLKNRS
jgi:hypothetical protein